MATTAVQNIDTALRDAGIPIDGVGDAGPPPWPAGWHVVGRADALAVRVDYQASATADQIEQGDQIVRTTDLAPRQPRSLWAIYDDIALLSAEQQNNIRQDIRPDQYAKLRTLLPPQDGPALVLHWCVTSTGPSDADKLDAQMRMATMISQQQPGYLVNPEFDPTISISGDEPVP